jgi:hypothetical protein
MIERSFDAARINELVNHPTIRPFVGGDGQSKLEMEPQVQDLQNYFLLGPHGGFAYLWSAPQTYEIHTFILPEGRGRDAYRLARESLEYMRGQGAEHLWTRVHPDSANVRRFTLAAGLKSAGVNTVCGVTYDLFHWRA